MPQKRADARKIFLPGHGIWLHVHRLQQQLLRHSCAAGTPLSVCTLQMAEQIRKAYAAASLPAKIEAYHAGCRLARTAGRLLRQPAAVRALAPCHRKNLARDLLRLEGAMVKVSRLLALLQKYPPDRA